MKAVLSKTKVRILLSAKKRFMNSGCECDVYNLRGHPHWVLKIPCYGGEDDRIEYKIVCRAPFIPPTLKVQYGDGHAYLQAKVKRQRKKPSVQRNIYLRNEAKRHRMEIHDSGIDWDGPTIDCHNLAYGTILGRKSPRWWLYDLGSCCREGRC